MRNRPKWYTFEYWMIRHLNKHTHTKKCESFAGRSFRCYLMNNSYMRCVLRFSVYCCDARIERTYKHNRALVYRSMMKRINIVVLSRQHFWMEIIKEKSKLANAIMIAVIFIVPLSNVYLSKYAIIRICNHFCLSFLYLNWRFKFYLFARPLEAHNRKCQIKSIMDVWNEDTN